MNEIANLIRDLKEKGIGLTISGDDLEVALFKDGIDPAVFEIIRKNKSGIKEYIQSLALNFIHAEIPGIATAHSYPISDAQHRLWVLSQFEDASVAYNMPSHISLNRDIDIESFKKAIASTIERHEILRTVFKEDEKGEIRQWILNKENSGFKINYRDFRKEKNKEEKVKNYIAEDSFKPFNLEKGPLLRAGLLQTGEENYVFYFNMHHIISDGWSMDILSRDVFAYYDAYKENKEPTLKPLRIQYKDYSAWQLSKLKEKSFETHRNYWLDNLSGELPPLDFPAAKQRPKIKTSNGYAFNTYIDAGTTRQLKKYSEVNGGSLFMGLLAAWNVLVYRYTSQKDIVTGTPVAGREHADLDDQIGFYVNTLALRNEIRPGENFNELFSRVRQNSLDAYSHQAYSFDRLVEELEQQRDRSRSAVFDIMLALQNNGEKIESPGLKKGQEDELTDEGYSASKFDLDLSFQEIGDYLSLRVIYNSDVYGKEMILGLVNHYRQLLKALPEKPGEKVSEIDFLSGKEKDQLLQAFNTTEADYPKDKTIVELFEQQVEKTPDNIALVFEGKQMTYRGLNDYSNKIAHFLVDEFGFLPGEKAGLILYPGFGTVASMLAVLKAGGAYVPIDPSFPEDRVKFIAADIKARLLIIEKEFIELANRLQWSVKTLQSYFCINSPDVFKEKGQAENIGVNQELWNYIGEKAGDQIAVGGWISSYTGETMPEAEMEEYAMNTYTKLKDSLHPGLRVLEIGCSSGIILNKIAPAVGFYYGIDLSPKIIANTRELVKSKGLKNVTLKALAAHEISQIEEGEFDLIIINSVVQYFSGHNYLRDVLKQALGLLKNKGEIFVGDVMDIDKKSELVKDLQQFSSENRGKGYKTKTEFSSELFVSRGFFEDLQVDQQEIAKVLISRKNYTIENELTRYRYDVSLSVDKTQKPAGISPSLRNKTQFSATVLDKHKTSNPGLTISSNDLAYIIYTSGSTGIPKGVMIEHLSLAAFFSTLNTELGLSGIKKIAVTTSITFDISMLEILGALCIGKELVLFSEDVLKDPDELTVQLSGSSVEAIQLTPSRLQQLFGSGQKIPSTIKLMLIGGEALSEVLYERLKKESFRSINVYGPTETTIWSTWLVIPGSRGLSIGKPLPNEHIYIVSEGGQLQPIGVTGEIYIGGAGLARGYLNQEDLTKEKFIKSPFKKGERLYKTGDSGRWLPDGNIEFIGRKDNQVKIRGHRIELGEIEHALLKNELVKEAVVLAKENSYGEKELVAYITATSEQNTNDLRSWLKELLPEYALPAYYVQMETLPLNTSGKVDRKALPDPQGLGLASGTEYVAPQNEIEEKLVATWEEILQREKIGIKDDFFTLGGHSLKAVRLSNAYQKEFAVKLSLKDLFDHTTIASHAELIGSAKKKAFIQIEKADKQESYPISDAQHRLWILSQFEDGSVAHNMFGNSGLDQDIEIESFKKAIAFAIERHEILRTVFKQDATGEIRQWVLTAEALGFEMDYKDFRRSQNKEEQVKEYMAEDSLKAFDLEKGPLLRAALLQVENERYVFHFNMHHIISDGWSMEILSKDVLSFYEAFKNNKEPQLKELRIQYKDYSTWQLAQLKEESFKEHKTYWLKSLEGELPLLDLPATKQRPRLKTYNGYGLGTYIDAETTAKLRKYSHEKGGSLFMGLLSAWNVLVYQYTSQKDSIIGTPVAGRDHTDLEDQIGFYINTLALRNETRPGENFDELFSRVKQNWLEAYSHGMYPFDRLVEELELQRNTRRSPVFDISITYHNNAQDKDTDMPENNATDRIVENGPAKVKVDVELHFKEVGECISFNLLYNVDVYQREMVEALMGHYKRLLHSLLSHPGEKISQVEYLSPEEKHEQLITFNTSKAGYRTDKTIVELFEQQVKRTPGNVALVFEGKELTYGELNERSDQLAGFLRKNYGITHEDLVGVQLQRSEWMIIAILGILKAGGAYVPVDPEYPAARKQYIIEDSSLKLLITEAAFVLDIDYYEGTVFAIDVEFDASAPGTDVVKCTSAPGNAAYVIYTSGSTGDPKGVVVEHGSVVNTLLSQIDYLQLDSNSKGLQFASFSFDASVWETFIILLSGGSLFIIGAHDRNDPALLAAFINTHKINVATLPPSYLNKIESKELKGLKTLITAGEPALYERAIEHLEFGTYYNAYGPTEASICTTIFKLESKDSLVSNNIPIGKPISKACIYILNEREGLQPAGTIGEICIGGAGVARGYLNQEELTREKFIVNPFLKGERLYKTGDLGRWLPDGNVEFIGRKDDQVKIRGYRIELGEIERALLTYDQVEEAVVLARENQNKEKELVAYITSKETQNAGSLGNYLKGFLPEYMLPAYYVQLEALPLTSNGKIDRKALPNPEGLGLASGIEYVAPQNETEEKLVKIWEEVLQREHIGVKDDFFALGGHSLKAVRLNNEYEKELGVKLSLTDLFALTDIQSHAELIKSSKKETFVQIEKVAVRASYPISDAQRRLWVLSQVEEGSVAYNMPVHVHLEQDMDIESFKKAVVSTIERHEALRTVFKADKRGEVRQWILNKEDVGFKIDYKDLRKEKNKEEKVKEYIAEDAHTAFDLEKGPLLRTALLQVEDQEYVFYFNIHHIIGDGWSMNVLSKDVLSYYEAYKENKKPQLKELRIQYKDYSAWQLSQLENESFKTHRNYWLSQLSGALPLLDLPASRPRPEVRTYNGRTVITYLNKEVTGRLRSYALAHEGTLFMGIMSALKALLYKYTGQQDLVLGTPIAGRGHSDLENQIGFYINALALRSQVNGRDSFDKVYNKVKTTILDAYTHQAYPFDRLVEELEQNRLASRSAVFDIIVVLQNTGEKISELSIPEEKIDEITELASSTCIYDVKFDFEEQGDYLRLLVEYNKDVYEAEMIESFIGHFKQFTDLAVSDPGKAIGTINYVSKEEKQKQISALELNKTGYPKNKTILDLFNEQVKQHKQNTAVVFENTSYSYEELNKRANQVAHFLIKEAGIEKEEKVGLLLTPGLDTVASMLGILKAGGAYVPMDPGVPEERLSFMVSDIGARVLITQKEFIETANRLQWGINSLKNYLCIDSDDVRSESEKQENVMMSQELWDHVGERAEDQITGGGWLSSYTGKAIPDAEMEEYAMNAYKKLKPSLNAGMRVLEIGCSSGLTLSKVAPQVGLYYGTDLSPVIISNTEKLISEKGLKNVKLKRLAAHEISTLEENNFDLIIINSVIQHFHGHNYLLKVIRDSISLLKDEGRIFIGDVMDLDKKKDLTEDLEAFKKDNQGKGYTTKTEFSSELFVARGYFEDLKVDEKEIAEVEISEKIRTIENELTKFRYDAILHIDKKVKKVGKNKPGKHKWQYGRNELDSKPKTDPKIKVTPDQLAYIIYTSGTTGKPKGVMVDHYNVVRLFKNDAHLYDFTSNDVWTMFHSYAFDFSVWEMYGALFFGGKLVVVPKQVAQDTSIYLELLANEGVTILNQTPSAFYNLSKEEESSDLQLQVRYVIFGGEALSPGKLQHWKNSYPGCKLINMYGITETTVHTTYKEISQEDIKLNRSNIGRAIPTVSCIVLDENKNLVPAGIAGELYVGGAGVARGYLNREELTKERFIVHPFIKGERLYRSGDKVKQLINGDLEYLGRVDDQVKIRGYRIELGEIEHALLKNGQVEKVVVLAKENQNGEKELVAYITAPVVQNSSNLRTSLKDLLPEYMLPAYFVQLAEMPLTANGKIDKKALPDPEGLGLGSGIDYVAPRNETEGKLVAIWEEVLRRKNIGIKDDFFTIGGDSIKATQIVVQVKKIIKKEIKVAGLYKYPTIESLGAVLAGQEAYKQNEDWALGIKKINEFKQKIINGGGENNLPEGYEDFYPITPIEQGMIFSSLMNPGEPVYYDQFIDSLRIDDVDAFRTALSIIVKRHAMLRTKYFMESFEEPVKIVFNEVDIPLFINDLSDLSKEKIEHKIQSITLNLLNTRLGFDNELLWSMHLNHVGGNEYLVVFCFHHALLDGWSTSIFRKELSQLLASDNRLTLAPLKCDYKDYTAGLLGRQESPITRSYWKNFLAGYSRNKLPFNHKGTKVSSETGMRKVTSSLEQEMLEKIEQTAKAQKVSVKSVFLAAYTYLLRILSTETDVITGVVTHDRPEMEDSDKMMGCFLYTVPVRVDFKNINSFRSLLQFVQNYLIDVKPHEVHLTDILRMIDEKASAGNPIFDTLLNFTDFHEFDNIEDSSAVAVLDDLFDETTSVSNEMTNTYFDLEVDKTLDRLTVKIKYVPRYFHEHEVSYALSMYVRILEKITGDIDQPLLPSELLLTEDKRFLLEEFNNTVEEYSKEKLVFELFEEQVKRTPAAIALRQDGATLSYKELNERSNQLAAYLIDQGVLPGENIGLLVDRSFDMITGMYAILKAGGAYVPIDPEYPLDRQKYIIENSEASRVICDSSYPVAEELTHIEFIKPDPLSYRQYSTSNPGIRVDTRQLAYTIYTSGSTGRPKGVMIEHHSAVNLVEWVNKTYGISETDRLLFITSMCFDLSVYDIFGILASGGSLVIARKEQVQDIDKLTTLLQQEKITFWDSVPTTLNYLVGELDHLQEAFKQESLRLVFLSGDWIPVQLPGRIKHYFPNAQVISLGGATEGTVWSNYYPIEAVGEMWSSIPYGKPISNNYFYILDANREPVAPGVAGELYIGGVGVARGYANDPEKTKASFVEDPFKKDLGGRMYRTGDLGRMLPDGNMEFLGRADHQVKIRGFRVELGEIESILCKHSKVKETVVDTTTGKDNINQLVAYYVSQQEIEIQELRNYLQDFLPGYMIPSFFIKLEELPLTSNGKINRRALPKPADLGLESSIEYIAPGNEIEESIAQTWRDVLGIEKIGINDNFFELGGHSLTATRLLTRVEKNFGVKIDLRSLFLKPTISGLSEAVTTLSWMKNKSEEVNTEQDEIII